AEAPPAGLCGCGSPSRGDSGDDLAGARRGPWSLLPASCHGQDAFTTRDLADRLGRPLAFAQRVAYCLRLTGAARVVGKSGNQRIYLGGAGGGREMSLFDAFRLDGKRACVTGGSRGLGLAMARGLAEAGADLVLIGRDETALGEARRHIEALGRRVE